MADDDSKTLGEPHPRAAMQSPADRGARTPAAEQNRQVAEQRAEVTPFTAEQLATPAPTLAGFRQMWVIVGPYRGHVLTMPDAEAESAKDNHWAIEMTDMAAPFDAANPPEHDHDLTDEDRAYAVKEANEWAEAQHKPAEPPPDPLPEGGATARDKALQPDKPGDYQTRAAPPRR